MRVLALDVGERRIGVAVGETDLRLASPVTAYARVRDASHDVAAVLRIAAEHEADEIVVGLPLSLSGDAGPQAQAVSRFARQLARASDLPVKTFDERHSTAEAERRLLDAGASPSRDRSRLDAAAATVILQAYLDSR